MKLYNSILSILLLLTITGCYIETAIPEKKKELVVVSDFLEAKDTVFFSDFAKKENVRVVIKTMNAKSIIDTVHNEKYNNGIDVIMMKSLYSVYRLHQNDIFHSVGEIADQLDKIEPFFSTKYNYVGIGMDPYIIVSNPDTNVVLRTYSELKTTKFISTLNNDALIPMLAPIMSKLNKVDSYSWIKAFSKKLSYFKNINATLSSSIPVALTSYSSYSSNFKTDSILKKYSTVNYPNQRTSGTFYNLRTICIIDQAPNYSIAKKFIYHYTKPTENRQLNEHLNTIPVAEYTAQFDRFKINSTELVQYYSMIQRILNKVTEPN